MRSPTLTLAVFFAALGLCYAGTERYSGKEMKQVEQPCPEWYADNEWNLQLWGAYAFPGNRGERSIADVLFEHENNEGIDNRENDIGHSRDDRFLNKDDVFGGGADLKYFFRRYYGVGIEGYALDGADAVYGVLGTFTLRFPMHCSRFSPYLFWGVGAAFNGSHDVVAEDEFADPEVAFSRRINSDSVWAGQAGGGFEVRFTRHIGWMADFSWNILEGGNNDFGMVRTGLTIAF